MKITKIMIHSINLLDVVSDSVDALSSAAKTGLKMYILTGAAGLKVMAAVAKKSAAGWEKETEAAVVDVLTKPIDEIDASNPFGSYEKPKKRRKKKDQVEGNGEVADFTN